MDRTAARAVLRRATEKDIALIREMADRAFRATYSTLLTAQQIDYMIPWMYGREVLEREFREGFAWFIAEMEGVACGYVSVERQEERLFHLQKIYVLPEFQGRGVGQALFDGAVGYIRSVQPLPCRMELNVNRRNPALGFYRRQGMRCLQQGDFPIGNGFYMNDFIMGLDLEAV